MNKCFGIAALMIAVAPGAFVSSPRAATAAAVSCLVTTGSGDVQGLDNGVSCAFLGIPFAAPPVGDLRWKPPQPAAAWAPAMLSAIAAAPNCPQFNLAGAIMGASNEDCLKLNIWTPDPAPAMPAPVIVWIHTGAFQATSANFQANNGRRLAELTGAIVVAANYRLGPFGFMGHAALTSEDAAYRSSGNYGFLDQRAALAWVRDHIAAFGGDPDNVTIGGQSAGAHSVGLHVVSPRSAGYFSRAIMHSGYASTRWRTLAEAESVGSAFAAALGCTDPSQVLTCMRGTTRDQVLLALPSIPGGQQRFAEHPGIPWGPVVDGLEIPDQPRRLFESGTFSRVPIIIGSTRDEGWAFVDRSFPAPAGLTADQYHAAVETEFGAANAPSILATYPAAGFQSPKHALSRLTGDAEYVCEARRVARLVSRTRTPVYEYSFEREADAVALDLVIHGLDTNFVFGNNFGPPSNYILNAEDLALFGSMSAYWTRFMATGNPNRHGHAPHARLEPSRYLMSGDDDDGDHDDSVVRWPAFKRRSDQHIVLDVPIRSGEQLRGEQCDFWEPYFLRSIVASVPASSPSSDLCGTTVLSNLKLDHDVTCAGNGLVIGADRINLDLNGHSITGAGSGVGIGVTGRSKVTIAGGAVRNFEAGVRVNNSMDIVVKGNEFQENGDGVDCQAGCAGNTIRENAFRDNRTRGVMLRSNSVHNVVRQNTFTGNNVGILVFGGIDIIVEENIVSENRMAGIRINVIATGNLIVENTITSNPAGVDFSVTPAGSATGNTVKRNTIAMNSCGVKGAVAGNTFKKNLFKANDADSCP